MGLPQPSTDTFALEGVSLRPLLEQPSLRVLPSRDYALSTYARCPQAGDPVPTPDGPRTPWITECIHDTERTAFEFMGYTIRTYSVQYFLMKTARYACKSCAQKFARHSCQFRTEQVRTNIDIQSGCGGTGRRSPQCGTT